MFYWCNGCSGHHWKFGCQQAQAVPCFASSKCEMKARTFVCDCVCYQEVQAGNGCQQYSIGRLIFGPRYTFGGKFDVFLQRYWFSSAKHYRKARYKCRNVFSSYLQGFDQPYIESHLFECCVNACVTLSVKTMMLNTANSKFTFAQIPTDNKLSLPNKVNAHP